MTSKTKLLRTITALSLPAIAIAAIFLRDSFIFNVLVLVGSVIFPVYFLLKTKGES
jgi:hypothetical protein